jgi:hypothetical protein
VEETVPVFAKVSEPAVSPKVRTPVVEETAVPEPMTVLPFTVSLFVAKFTPCAPTVVKVPERAVEDENIKVTEPVFETRMLLKEAPEEVAALVPEKTMRPVPPVKVAPTLFVKSAWRSRVPEPLFKVPAELLKTLTVEVTVPATTWKLPVFVSTPPVDEARPAFR